MQTRLNAFYEQFNAVECSKDDLVLYKWDMIINYIESCAEFCIREIDAMQSDRTRIEPSMFFVTQ